MKKLLVVLGLMLASTQAFALWPSHVYQAVTSSVTFTSVSVSTSAATRMDNPVLPARTYLEVQNQDAATLYCGPSSSTTTLKASGRVVISSGSWNVGLGDALGLWCLSGNSGSTKAVVIQGY